MTVVATLFVLLLTNQLIAIICFFVLRFVWGLKDVDRSGGFVPHPLCEVLFFTVNSSPPLLRLLSFLLLLRLLLGDLFAPEIIHKAAVHSPHTRLRARSGCHPATCELFVHSPTLG